MTRRLSCSPLYSPTDLILFLLALAIGVSLLVSPFPARSRQALLPLAVGFLLYFSLAKLPQPSRALYAFIGLIALFQALFCFLGLVGMETPRLDPARYRPFLTALRTRLPDSFNPNVVAGLLVLAYDTGSGQQIAQGFTDELGHLQFTAAAQGAVRLNIPYLGINQLVGSDGASIYIRLGPRGTP